MDFTEIAGYRIVRQLGAGGMGQVFLAEHPRLPRMDALKLLDAGVTRSDDFKARFVREADMLAKLSHPNIVTPYDRGEFEGRLWIAMEYVDGTDAAELVKEHGPLDVDLVFQLVDGAGAALDYVWRKERVTHRDVKPANTLVGIDDGQVASVKLADFGIAKAVGEGTSLTSTGMTVGTMQYVSPEAIEGHELDNRADIYSLACTAFHLLAGQPPFDGPSITALLSAHLTKTPPRISEVVPHLPVALDSVFARALAKNPNDRYSTCVEFVSALRNALSGIAEPAYAGTISAPAMSAPTAVQKRRTTVLAAVATLLAIAVVAVAGYAVYQARGISDDVAAPATSSSRPQTTTASRVTTTTTVVPEPTWTPEVTVETTTETPVPYEGMPCSSAEFNTENADGTLYCSALEGAWTDKTHQGRGAVEQGSECSEPGARARISRTEAIATCSQDSSGGYSWQY